MGVPIKLLHEGEGHGVTVEMKNGEIYRGHLDEAEDTMNCFMTGGEATFMHLKRPYKVVSSVSVPHAVPGMDSGDAPTRIHFSLSHVVRYSLHSHWRFIPVLACYLHR